MGLKKKILNCILRIINAVISLFPIKQSRITIVSLEAGELESDLLLLYNALSKNEQYTIQTILMKYDRSSIWNDFRYMLNTIQQIWYINRSKVVIINDNNYVVSTFKRPGVTVIQVWHATGAIKKFGNVIKRTYPIANYDYVIANSEYWKKPYSQAFNISKEQVAVLGMPRVDHLFDANYVAKTKKSLMQKYPILKGKKVIVYAPTFRGNVYKGFTGVDLDVDQIMKTYRDTHVFVYKLHPLLKDNRLQHAKYAMSLEMEETHDLFTIADILISDFSSVIFDFSILEKKMILYAPDAQQYFKEIGTFVPYPDGIPAKLCSNEEELIKEIAEPFDSNDIRTFKEYYFTHQDGQNTKRVVAFIDEIMQK